MVDEAKDAANEQQKIRDGIFKKVKNCESQLEPLRVKIKDFQRKRIALESGIRDVHAENRYVAHVQLIQLALNYKQTFFQICT